MLRVLEEGTPWANKAELYIGLIKEAVRKDMKDSNCPLAFWCFGGQTQYDACGIELRTHNRQ